MIAGRSESTLALGLRWLVMLILMGIYLALMSSPLFEIIQAADKKGCIGWHVLLTWALTVLGMIATLTLFVQADVLVERLVGIFLPHKSLEAHQKVARYGAMMILVGNALVGLIWTNRAVNVFVDAHKPLYVETDLSILAMGLLGGLAWRLLWKKWAWLGLIVTVLMSYGVVANVLSRHGWC
ncbi:hypothetical protein [Sulfobacillus thermosulfidooxidans]|uniref:hypothetical protein n=1 Tax=Sulfobacillus thermosulfidooxidans TaxID=28034 RepID=UPI00096B7F83|nr:hypothetical protein [Sulfobacillus thermosulfidooxidans]OLZ09136.1 hypothetical protein BFX05_14675 [Sulfobacillus thermosulfidooxidans]OLZ16449.1 hypothetical protein BFX06_14805 [Sulfobacillus thermosulfidooxidans]OLZ19536.1 hypothetical protein BFX07_02380 [Sulfobacillus thermosulfidooxidans]